MGGTFTRGALRRVAPILLLAVLAGGGYWLWDGWLKDRTLPKRLAVVEPGFLYRSGQIHPRLIRDTLERHEIDRVLAMFHHDPRRPEHVAEKDAMRALGVEGLNLHLHGDGTGKPEHYVEALTALARAESEGERVLVHCEAGVRRAASVVSLYLLLVKQRPVEDVYAELNRFQARRSITESPLLPYLNRNLQTIARGLVERGVIARVPDPLPVVGPPGWTPPDAPQQADARPAS